MGMEQTTYTAFSGPRLVASGNLIETLGAVKKLLDDSGGEPVLIFNDDTGEQVDFDFRGSLEDVLARVQPPKPKTRPGRPSLGVVCGEVSLLPRHWEWLERQQHNVSATIRRLVDEAIRNEPASARAKRALEAADRVLWILGGNLPGCEEASRALYARSFTRFRELIADWPGEIAGHLSRLVGRAE